MIMEQYLRIGVITRAHGVHGEVKVFPTTDYPERFEEIKDVVIRTPKGEICTEVEGVKYFKNLAIVKFGCKLIFRINYKFALSIHLTPFSF